MKEKPALYKTKIVMDSPDKFIGLEIHKKECVSKCVGYENYITKKTGEEIILLLWECAFLTGERGRRKTPMRNLRIGDLPSKKGKND